MTRLTSNTTLMAIIACVLWSTAFVGIKIGLKYTTPLQFAGTRFFLSGLMILPVIGSLKQKLILARPYYRKIVFVGFIQTFLQYALFYTGIAMVPGAVGALVIGSGPLFVAVVAHFFMPGDRLTRHKIVSVLLGLAGIAVITLGRNKVSGNDFLILGVIILLGNNLLSGVGNVIVSRDGPRIHPLVLSSFSMITGGLMLFIIGLLTEKMSDGPFPAEYYLSLIWLSFLSAAAISIWYTLLKRPKVKVSELNMWKFIIPVLGAVQSWLILPNEKPDLTSVVGMGLVVLALVLISKPFTKLDRLRQ